MKLSHSSPVQDVPVPRVTRVEWLTRVTSIILLLVVASGCGIEQRESLYESEHTIPAHWPNDVGDTVAKIDERVTLIKSQPTAQTANELADIIGWAPEIAADSDLTEDEWLPIYEVSTTLSSRVRTGYTQMTDGLLEEVMGFRKLVDDRAAMLAQREQEAKQRAIDYESKAGDR